MIKLLSITQNAESLIEYAGRNCYNSNSSNDPNAPVEQWNTDKSNHKTIIRAWIDSKHDSVLEHASASFEIICSRAALAQITRHRVGMSYSVRSQRYVNEKDFGYIVPNGLTEEVQKSYDETMEHLRNTYETLIQNGMKKEDARLILPNACLTTIVMTGNFRAWRHFITLRGEKHAQWEIRDIAIDITKSLKHYAPVVFSDFEIDEETKIIVKI